MKKAALIGGSRIQEVYGAGRLERLKSEFDLYPDVLTHGSLSDHRDALDSVEFLFSTWGMPALVYDEIATFSELKALFYAAGSVQRFARPFLDAGVRVFSAWAANAVPVAEFTVAQILLANKGFFRASRAMITQGAWKANKTHSMPGNFEVTVALLGAGMIGRKVIELLKPYKLNVIVFDPFLSDADARKLKVERVEISEAFKRGFVVSNHLANLPATKGMITKEHIASMQPYATFINTGRGATVDEAGMIDVLQERPDLTALLDVTDPEPPAKESPLYTISNVVLSPHIAGSIGNEVHRMADYMIEEAVSLRDGLPLRYEVTAEMLKTMA